MRVRITITVDVEPEAWMAEYGCPREEVRDNVKSYYGNGCQQAYPSEAEIVKDVTWK